MNESGHHDLAISKALETFLQCTCAVCKKRLCTLCPCGHCGDGSLVFRISYEDIPNNWSKCEFRISIVERDIKDNKRSYTHKKSSRKDLDLVFRKKMGRDGRSVCEVLLFDRMSKRKIYRVHVIEGDSFLLDHDEIKLL